jgi:hypothetical protein
MLTQLDVKPGDVISGRYKRAHRDANELRIQVEATIAYRRRGMLVGTNLNLANGGQRIAVYAGGFDPRSVKVEPSDEPVEFDPAGAYLTPSAMAFGFVEQVDEQDREWAELCGGICLATLVVGSIKVAAVAGQ